MTGFEYIPEEEPEPETPEGFAAELQGLLRGQPAEDLGLAPGGAGAAAPVAAAGGLEDEEEVTADEAAGEGPSVFGTGVTQAEAEDAIADSYADLELREAAQTELAEKDRAAGKTNI